MLLYHTATATWCCVLMIHLFSKGLQVRMFNSLASPCMVQSRLIPCRG